MSEEFEESDVIFSDHFTNSYDDSLLLFPEIPGNNQNNKESRRTRKTMTMTMMAKKSSSPVAIPASVLGYTDYDSIDGGSGGGEGEITPPHVIIERRLQGKTACSVCTGKGRTLKGRDLSRVRNSVLRLTGFLEV